MSLRKFTKALGRYQVGVVHDYPRGIWNKMAKDAGMPLDKFTEEVMLDNPVTVSALKGKFRRHTRLGATQ